MRISLKVLGGLALLLTAAQGAPQEEGKEDLKAYQEWMQEAGAAVAAIKKTMETDLEQIQKDASRLIELFDQVQAFWIRRDVDDAQEWALNVQDYADDLLEAAEDDEKEAAAAAFKTMTENCAACHAAHREKLPDGSFRIKQR